MRIRIHNAIIPGIVFAASLCVSSLSAQETGYTDLYYNMNLSDDGWTSARYMQNAAAWNVGSPDGSVFEGDVNSASNNLFIITSSPTTSDKQTLFGYRYSNWNIHDLTINMEMTSHYDMVELVPNQHLTIGGNLDITISNHAKWWSPFYRVKLDSGSSITVEGDMRVENSMTAAEAEAGSYGQTGIDFCLVTAGSDWNASFAVKGNLVFVGADTHMQYTDSDGILFSTSAASITVGGYVDMTQTRAGTRTWDLFDATSWDSCTSDIYVGGLEGGGALRITNAHDATVNLTFTNSSEHSYSGTFASRAASSNKLNVEMDAAAQSGRQTLIIQEGGAVTGDTALDPSRIESVTVRNGTFNFGTYSGLVNGTLNMAGENGRLEISAVDGTGAGTVAFENAVFESGSIVFTIEEVAADKIEISGALSKSGAGKIAIEFDADSYDVYEWILASGSDTIEYELITFGSTDMSDSDFTAAANLGGGVFATLLLRDNALAVQFSTVPEPAEAAAVLGLLALFAAARRRK